MARPKPRLTVSGPTKGALCSWRSRDWCRCECCHSSLLRIFVNGSTSYETTPETLANSCCSLGMRPRQDYSHLVVLTDCVSACLSPMCQYSALILLKDGHPLTTGHKCESVRHWILTSSFLLTSVLQFPYFCFRTSAFSTCHSFQFSQWSWFYN